jgi:hypothetical protein
VSFCSTVVDDWRKSFVRFVSDFLKKKEKLFWMDLNVVEVGMLMINGDGSPTNCQRQSAEWQMAEWQFANLQYSEGHLAERQL